jgi:RecA-family ATPase
MTTAAQFASEAIASEAIGEPPEPLQFIDPPKWQGKPIPERRWLVRDWIPWGLVTLLSGPGGIGKSLLAQQLLTGTATGTNWLGLPVDEYKSIGVFCEDTDDELHRRQAAINLEYQCDFVDIGSLRLLPRLGFDNLLMTFARSGKGELTPFYHQLREAALDWKAKIILVDTIPDSFGGNQNDSGQVRHYVQFCLGGLARAIDGAVIGTAHPSRSGQNNGTGESGSVQWDATVRSRLYLTEPPKQDDGIPADPDARVLSRKKANYATRDATIDLLWQDWTFRAAVDERDRPDAKTVFLTLFDETGPPLSDNSRAGNYAPKVFASKPGNWGYKKGDFLRAMNELLRDRVIINQQYGYASRGTYKLVRNTAMHELPL